MCAEQLGSVHPHGALEPTIGVAKTSDFSTVAVSPPFSCLTWACTADLSSTLPSELLMYFLSVSTFATRPDVECYEERLMQPLKEHLRECAGNARIFFHCVSGCARSPAPRGGDRQQRRMCPANSFVYKRRRLASATDQWQMFAMAALPNSFGGPESVRQHE